MGLGRDRNTTYGRKSSPEKRYRDFAKENEAWDRRVKKSIEKIDKASRREHGARGVAGT
jgi:hypothetical protein